MTPAQWRHIPERIKALKTKPLHIKKASKEWCIQHKVDLKNFRLAIEQGRYAFDIIVIECIGFDIYFYRKLAVET